MQTSIRRVGARPLAAVLLVLAFVFPAPAAGAAPLAGCQGKGAQPHIVFVLFDDLGFGDLGVLFQNDRKESRRLHTPHMDRLAGEGTLLTRHYCPAPVCAPSRASLMLGQHQGHAAIRNNQFDKALPEDHNVATVLKAAGYSTALIGKWGLQGKGSSPETWPAYPTKVGFDEFFGYVRHRDGHSHYPAHKTEARPPMELYDGDAEVSATLSGCYTADLFTARAKKLLVDHRAAAPETPLFLLLAYDTPHAALHVPSTAYPEGSGLEGGLQWLGEAGRMISTASEPIDSWIHPDYRDQGWTNSEKRFATMVRRLDTCLGDLVATLDELGMGENTLLVLTSDNGPHKEAYTPGRRYGADRFDSFGPLDGIKRDVYEGGIRVPTLVRWPGVARAGQRDNAPSQFHDWLPTLAEAAGVAAPMGVDGASLVAELRGEPRSPSRDARVYVEYVAGGKTPSYEEFLGSRRGERRGEMQVLYLDGYKGVRTNIQSWDDPFQIYDTAADPGEARDLAETSDRFRLLGRRMRDEVLRMRRPNPSAVRPYDEALVPALPRRATEEGLMALRAGPTSTLSGFIDIPVSGPWTFTSHCASESVLRIHRATVIDDDYQSSGEPVSGLIPLEAGLHAISVSFPWAEDGTPPVLSWQGPGTEEETIPTPRLRRPPLPKEPSERKTLEEDLQKALEEGFAGQELVGLAAAVVSGGEIVEFHLGFEDREAGIAVGEETRFRWASISKPLTAIAAQWLAEQGALDLDADVRTYLPEFPEKPWPITSRQLLQHRGGVVHYSNGPVRPAPGVTYGVEHPFQDVVVALDRFSASPLVFEPGTRHAYTTHGYMLLGAAVQRASGKTYDALVQDLIAAPLGMATLRPDYEWETIEHRAVGYGRMAGIVRSVGSADVSWKLPGGGYLSTVGDLARFADGISRRRILRPESWEAMWTPQAAPETDSGSIGYGLGFGLRKTPRGKRVSHSGSQQKTRTLMQVYPQRSEAVVLMTNSQWAQLAPIAEQLWATIDVARER